MEKPEWPRRVKRCFTVLMVHLDVKQANSYGYDRKATAFVSEERERERERLP